MCRPKHVEQLRNIGIINSAARLDLVGSFYEIQLAQCVPIFILHCYITNICSSSYSFVTEYSLNELYSHMRTHVGKKKTPGNLFYKVRRQGIY